MHHPNIATVFEINQSDEQQFIAMEFIEGRTLNDLLESKPFKIENTISVAMQVLDGLANTSMSTKLTKMGSTIETVAAFATNLFRS